ncbi:MAG TPA: MgtC/SapB family protein [Roseiarcus sp.]
MTLSLTWADIALRIALTVLAAGAIGFDRDVEGHSAGLRTVLFVALAACLAMLQANWLMNTVGKSSGSFVQLDVMRLPLGILTGVGFIGGGAILKRGEGVQGVTTAATLWFVTVVGLCFGGGQIGLGVVGGVLGLLILRALKILERKFKQERASRLRLKWKVGEYDVAAAISTLRDADLEISSFAVKQDAVARVEELRCSVRRLALREERSLPPVVAEVVGRQGVLEWEWSD